MDQSNSLSEQKSYREHPEYEAFTASLFVIFVVAFVAGMIAAGLQ